MRKLLLLLLFALPAVAQDEKPITISGIVFGDYYHFASSHDPELDGRNGFVLRRGYLTFDKTISDEFIARLRFEVNQPGDYRTNANMEPFVKDAYLRWKYNPRHELVVGIQPTATWEVPERLWGYRPVSATVVDLFRLGSSRDFGIAATGAIGTRSRYHVMFGNGTGVGSETNDGKKVAAAFSYAPTKETLIEVYTDRADADRSNYQLFAAWTAASWRTGLQLARQKRPGRDIDVASVYGVMDIRNDVTILGRIDRLFDPHPEAERFAFLPMDPRSEATLFIVGVDYQAHRNVSVMPNVQLVAYDEDIDNELLARLTFVFTF